MKIPLLSRIFNKTNGSQNETLPPLPASPIEAYKQSRNIPAEGPVCLAPWTSISFGIDGFATICCQNRKTAVPVSGKTISDIWNSDEFRLLREAVKRDNLDHDCSICKKQIDGGNFSGVKAANYDMYWPYHPEKPVLLEFCLENTCNLECVMCNSLLSSSIRKREKLPDLTRFYGDEFVQDLEQYMPHLKEMIFAGGEPFLIPLYYKIWEKALQLNPAMTISIITNGSTLNSRIKDMMERGRFRINVSIDSVHPEMYEAIRQNARFDTLMQNFEWFKQYSLRKNLPLSIPACPLTNNWQGIPDLVRFANHHQVYLSFVYVDRPLSLSLTHCAPEFLDTVIASYRSEQFENNSEHARSNIERFNGLISDLVKWREINHARTLGTTLSLQSLEQIIDRAEGFNPTDVPLEEAKAFMHTQVKTILESISPDKHPLMLNVFTSYTLDRLYQFLRGKSPDELKMFFKEYVGR